MRTICATMLLVLSLATTLFAVEKGFDQFEIVPKPQSLEIDGLQTVALTNNAPFLLQLQREEQACVEWVRTHAKQWFGLDVAVQTVRTSEPLPKEGYRLKATPNGGIVITANDLIGTRYAMITLRQIAMPKRGTFKTESYILPALNVTDAPKLNFRAIHFCWFPGQKQILFERFIRWAALLKYNYVILETFGTFRYKSHPWVSWPDADVTHQTIKDLRRVAEEYGITLVPDVNVWGHAAYSAQREGKHSALDLNKEYEVLFEPDGGWVWCLSNPHARRVLLDMVDELHEAFGRPPFVHIGCDEAYNAPHCPACREAGYLSLVESHIRGLVDYMKVKGARVMMWHDMLIDHTDERWKGFVATGTAETARLLDRLPKDIVICDWYYPGYWGKKVMYDFPTMRHFMSKGFDTIVAPWDYAEGTRAQGKWAVENGVYGVIQTVWNHFYGERLVNAMNEGSCAGWGQGVMQRRGQIRSGILRMAGWDAGVAHRKDTGNVTHAFDPETMSERD